MERNTRKQLNFNSQGLHSFTSAATLYIMKEKEKEKDKRKT